MSDKKINCLIGECGYPEGECLGECRMLVNPQREGDQQLPTPNKEPAIQDLVMQDMIARKLLGQKRYGTPLQPHNGRDMMQDLYEELLDACNYIRGAIYERDGK